VPYVVGGDVAGAYPETSAALANYINERIIDRRGDTMTGQLNAPVVAAGAPGGTGTGLTVHDNAALNRDVNIGQSLYCNGVVHMRGAEVVMQALPPKNDALTTGWSWLVRNGSGQLFGVPDAAWRLTVAVIASGSTAALKTGIDDPARTPDITALTPRQFEWTDEAYAALFPGQRYGLIAEEVAAVDKRLVTVDPETGAPTGLDQHALIAALIAKVTELQSRIDALEAP
jgi:hypothetical protein